MSFKDLEQGFCLRLDGSGEGEDWSTQDHHQGSWTCIPSSTLLSITLKVKVAQSCLTLCDSMDCIVHGILQAKILEWVAIPFAKGSSQPRDRTQVSCIAGVFFTS